MQVAELGTIETPIMLTNTFGVAAWTEALVRRAISANPAIGAKDLDRQCTGLRVQ